MDGGDSAVAIDHESCGQRFEPAVEIARGVIAEHNAIVDFLRVDEGIDRFPTVIVHRNSDYFEAAVFVLALEFGEPGNFNHAGAAPGSPEIEQYNFAFVIGEVNQLAVRVFQREIGRVLTFAVFLDNRSGWLRGRACNQSEERGHPGDRDETQI